MKWNINDIPVFTAVVAKKGISAAAKHLNMPKSTVSRCLSRLESDLDVRLLERNSRRFRVTPEGDAFYKHCLLIMEQVEAAQDRVSGFQTEPSGPLNVIIPMAFCREILRGHLAEFHRRYPKIELDIRATNEHVNLIHEGIDVGFQLGPLPDSDLVATTLYETPLIWVTSETYRQENPEIEDFNHLEKHLIISDKRYQSINFSIRHMGQKKPWRLQTPMHTTDPIMVREMVIQGCGVSLVPEIFCQNAFADGRLTLLHKDVEVLPATQFMAVYPSRKLLSEKARLLINFLREIITQNSQQPT